MKDTITIVLAVIIFFIFNTIKNNKINEMSKKNEQLNSGIEYLTILNQKLRKEIDYLSNIHPGNYKLYKNNDLRNNTNFSPNLITYDENNRLTITSLYDVNKFEDFYDIIINIKSVKDIDKGWEIKMNEKGKKQYFEFKDEKIIRIGIIGNSNKGKSFLLSKISKINLPSGTSIKTEGLSIKYPELSKFKNRKIALLDSAGLETPVLFNEDDETEENIINDDNKNNTGKNKTKNENNLKRENMKELFKEKSREKLITELFLQNYIMTNSDILILVVDILTYSEQKLINRVKSDMIKGKIDKPLYIIHNLKSFVTRKQVEDYIENTLLKCATFELEEKMHINTKIENITGRYYTEKEQKVFHLIFANDISEAGSYFNQLTLDIIEDSYKFVTNLKTFDVIESVKERFVDVSKDILEKSLEINDFIDNDEIINNKKIQLKHDLKKKIVLKSCLIDELGFSNFKGNGFEPKYNYFKKDDKIIIRVEVPGNCNFNVKLSHTGEYTIIKINGIKRKDLEPLNIEDNIHNTREFGEFNINILIKTEDFFIKNQKPEQILKNGVLIISYLIDETQNSIKLSTEDEI